MTATLATSEGIVDYVDGVFKGARMALEAGGKLNPVGIVFAWNDPESGLRMSEPAPIGVPLNTSSFGPRERDLYAARMRMAAKELDACGVMIVNEAWFRWATEDAERRECIVVLVDHKKLGQQQWVAYVDRSGPTPALGTHMTLLDAARQAGFDVGKVNATGAAGRFASIMPERWMN